MVYFIFNFILALFDIWLIEFFLSKNYIIKQINNERLYYTIEIVLMAVSICFFPQHTIIQILLGLLALLIAINKYDITFKELLKCIFLFLILHFALSGFITNVLCWVFNIKTTPFHINWSLSYKILIESIIRYLELLILIYITNRNTKKDITLHNFKSFSFFLSIYFCFALIINNDKLFVFPNVGRTFVIVIVVYNIALVFFDRFQTHHEQLEYDHKQLKTDSASESLYFKEHVVGNDQMRSIKHDMKNHMLILYSYVSSNNKEVALEYIKTIQDEIEIASATLHTGIPPLDSVITSKVKTMTNKGIKYSEKFKMITLGVVFDSDLALMLASALDNAIEAAEKSEDKTVSLEISTELNYICIKLVNSIKKGSKPNFKKTTKEDKTKHGFGYKKIKSIIKKYNGDLYTDITHDKVMMTITLRID